MDTYERALAYIEKLPAGISGSGGHDATLRAACECVRFGLSEADTWAAMQVFNARCSPPWKEHELRHKIASARQKAQRGQRVGPSKRPARVWTAPEWKRPAVTVPVMYRSEAEEEAFWDRVAVELGTTLEVFDANCGVTP